MADPADLGASAHPTSRASRVEVTAADLEGPGVVFCPNPRMPVWNHHPRVFIDVATRGIGKCPYCGTEYALADGTPRRGGH